MRYILLFCALFPNFCYAVIDNEVRNLSGGGSSSGLGMFIGAIISIALFVGTIKLFANLAWNAGIKRRVNIPNGDLNLRVANCLLDYEGGVDMNTWVTREEYDRVQREVGRLNRIQQEDLAKYYEALNELEQPSKRS